MPIPIANPQTVSVELKDYGHVKIGKGYYKFSVDVQPFLTSRGWTFLKHTRGYVHLMPPDGVSRPFPFAVEVPAREQIEQLANERHAIGEAWMGSIGEWPAFYGVPQGMSWQEVNILTGEEIGEAKPSKPAPPFFTVGYRGLWQGQIRFTESGPTYHETPTARTTATQPTLFDATIDPEQDTSETILSPRWQRDELILALDLYLANAGGDLATTDQAVVELSGLLNALPIHRGEVAKGFRNPTEVELSLTASAGSRPADKALG
jgi:hypothetical protein